MTEEHGTICKCEAFTSDKIEFIPAYEIAESQKGINALSACENYIELCVRYGIDRPLIQDFMDYQTMTDFVISNTDEHLANFGVLRDADTMKLIGLAPIFDSGNSMFFDEERWILYSRGGLLGRRITSFFKTEDKMLKKVKNRALVRMDLLPCASEVKELYENAGIPERKAAFITKNYELKLQMFQEFQKGKTLSLYEEHKREKMGRERRQEKQEMPVQSFIMLCGIPGSGKSEQAAKICRYMETQGWVMMDGKELYPVIDAVRDSVFLINKKKQIAGIKEHERYRNAVVLISANGIRDELNTRTLYFKDDLVFHIAETRTRIALMSGASVVYDASNLKAKDRDVFLRIADEIGVKNREVYIMWTEPKHSRADISSEKLEILHRRFAANPPSFQEGWTNIVNCTTEKAIADKQNIARGEQNQADDLER